jgi:ribosomal protein L24E
MAEVATYQGRTHGRLRLAAAGAVLALTGAAGAAVLAPAAASATGTSPGSASPAVVLHSHGLPAINLVWTQTANDAGSPIAMSSPNLITINGTPMVVVGDRAGNLLAYNENTGTPINGNGVLYQAPGPIDSTPSTFPGWNGVLFGVGNAASPYNGGYFAVNGNGTLAWSQAVQNVPGDPSPFSAVAAGLSVGNAPGIGPFAVAGSIGEKMYAFNGSGGVLSGFPFIQPDGDYSTPAIAPVYLGSSQPFIVDNGDSTAGVYNNVHYPNGNLLRIISTSGQQQCVFSTNQSGESSPAVGQFLGNSSTVGIAFGTGDYFPGASNTDMLFAVGTQCNQLWSATLDGVTASSPALANTQANGTLQVVEGTNVGNNNSSGTVYDLNGANGSTIWSTPAAGAVIGSIATVDPSNQGYQDLLVPTTGGIQILDGKTGANLALLEPYQAFQNAPLVTTDANGSIGITVAGYNSSAQGVVSHFEIAGSTGNIRSTGHAVQDVLNQTGGWPMFHHDAELTGDAGITAPVLQVPCNAPVGALHGYYEAATDGGVFNFGNLPFCGSTGAITLNEPVVGIAATKDGGGYWMVASDGGIFAFGNAKFYGSMGGRPLNEPVVGMAATPDGKGYYLVASDGGIFSFGDAAFYGSTGAIALNKPIVAMALTPDGKGYWLVASDGGVFAFGDAKFHGSMGGKPLNAPVVSMAGDSATGGYWEFAADGGVFNFGAPLLGSLGSTPLNAPIVDAASLANGTGYRMVASDGGIFDFGAATYYGSMGGKPLNQPIVSLSGF